jgi:hypothetical protein
LATPLPIIRPPTMENPFLPAAGASKALIMEFASLSRCQQTAHPARFIESSPHMLLLQKASLLGPKVGKLHPSATRSLQHAPSKGSRKISVNQLKHPEKCSFSGKF